MITPDLLKTMTISQMIYNIRRDLKTQGKKVPFGAVPYMDALSLTDNMDDRYGVETARDLVPYLLCNLSTYRGETARMIKAEFNRRLKG